MDLAGLARRAQTAVAEQVAALTGTTVTEVVVVIDRLVPVEARR